MNDIMGFGTTPTNKEFTNNFRGIAGTRSKKGHLNKQERDSEDVVFETGELVRIEKAKIKDNGWVVRVRGQEYNCTNDSSIVQIPSYTETKLYYIPKERTKVDVSLDKQSKVYKILKIGDENSTYMVASNGSVKLDGTNIEGNDEVELKQDGTSIKLTKNGVQITGDIVITDSKEESDDINLTEELEKLKKEAKEKNVTIEELLKNMKELQEEIEKLKKPKVGG